LALALEHGPCSSRSLDSPDSQARRHSEAAARLVSAAKDRARTCSVDTQLDRFRQLTVPAPEITPVASDAEEATSEPEADAAESPRAPNAELHAAMAGRSADWARIRRMAERIRQPRYMLTDFFHDCVASFPELRLFVRDGNEVTATPSGRTAEAEYQRTIGALFAVYWLLRLDLDGRVSFCYGVDADWLPAGQPSSPRSPSQGRRRSATDLDINTRSASHTPMVKSRSDDTGGPFHLHRRHSAPDAPRMEWPPVTGQPTTAPPVPAPAPPPTTSFFKMSSEERRASFLSTMDWSMFEDLVRVAGCSPTLPRYKDRVVALLCLTAFHDVMKVPALLPVVQPEHAPYCGYEAGVRIRDHDVALSYVLEHFPELMPSYQGLPASEQRSVLFTQGKMQFNHGWFVQAEAPPGAMLSGFKAALSAGADAQDIGLYFLHWITDLAGAEATPLGGAEKFVLKFPHAVLASFLWSIPFLEKLHGSTETEVVEAYLQARWLGFDPMRAVPMDNSAVACMRLAVMAQGDLRVVDAFQDLDAAERDCLATELARTGCRGQRYACIDRDLRCEGGPALLVYYGPALLQKHCEGSEEDFRSALRVLSQVLRIARELWPLEEASEGSTATVQVGSLKAENLEAVTEAPAGKVRQVWVLVRHNDLEGAVELVRASALNSMYSSGTRFKVIDFDASSADFARVVSC